MTALLKWLYEVFKRPVAFAIAGIILLNVFAACYTICSNTFLNSFCPKEEALLRYSICTRWENVRLSHRNLSAVDSAVKQPYARYLNNEDSTLSYKLPYALSLWEQAIYALRFSMAESGYPLREKERFHEQFSDYIEQSARATTEARRFYVHMMGTIHDYISASR